MSNWLSTTPGDSPEEVPNMESIIEEWTFTDVSLTDEKLHDIALKIENWQAAVARGIEVLPSSDNFTEEQRTELLDEVLALDVADLHRWAELLTAGQAEWKEAVK